jgi:hypothetical protein
MRGGERGGGGGENIMLCLIFVRNKYEGQKYLAIHYR